MTRILKNLLLPQQWLPVKTDFATIDSKMTRRGKRLNILRSISSPHEAVAVSWKECTARHTDRHMHGYVCVCVYLWEVWAVEIWGTV